MEKEEIGVAGFVKFKASASNRPVHPVPNHIQAKIKQLMVIKAKKPLPKPKEDSSADIPVWALALKADLADIDAKKNALKLRCSGTVAKASTLASLPALYQV